MDDDLDHEKKNKNKTSQVANIINEQKTVEGYGNVFFFVTWLEKRILKSNHVRLR